jgi:phosphoribosylaminoimidazole carboxylase
MLNILGGHAASSHLAVAREALGTLGAHVHLYGKGDARPGRKMGHVTVVAESMAMAEDRIWSLVTLADSNRHASKTTGSNPRRILQTLPAVGVTMGSKSDLPVLEPGLTMLRDLGIPYHVTITSAHRTPKRMMEYAETAATRGAKVIIAAAGGAAHLPGMLASLTTLPVIGVPVKASTLDGMDSLLSIVQMPVS